MRERRVDEHAEQAHEQEIAREAHALRERPGDERRRDDRELQLKQREHHQRDRGCEIRMRLRAHAREHEKGEGVANQTVDAVAKGQAEPDDDPQDADDGHRHETLQHRGDDVLRPDHAAVEKRQAGRHEQHETRGREHPGHVAAIHGTAGDGLRRRPVECAGQTDGCDQDERQGRPDPFRCAPLLCQRHQRDPSVELKCYQNRAIGAPKNIHSARIGPLMLP